MVVALMVIGPERLPKVARTLGHFYGRARRYVYNVKSDIERDMAIEELQQLKAKVQVESDAVKKSVTQGKQTVEQQVQKINRAVSQPLEKPQQEPSSDEANNANELPEATETKPQ